ncbi:hypothetical protein [Foetidibacter luteolus]|uniref:hypothetical protein n=1 Tax=Foetidibacter luteolus TaxID=2608880 RepID=UPI00129B0049|nr:hypothetical protein [Foetidibacter luteolus]
MVNAYPEKPAIPYMRTTVEMPEVIHYLKALNVPAEIKRGAYIIFRNEGANGRSGINHNYIGVQADSGRWPAALEHHIVGVVTKRENQTGKLRLFCAFRSWQPSVDFLVDRVQKRGFYIGGTTTKIVTMKVNTPEDLATAYYRSWVKGDAKYKLTESNFSSIKSMYNQASKIFL